MASTVWRGHLSFGLISIPVRLFTAARAEPVRMRQLVRRTPKSAPAPEAPPSRGKGPAGNQPEPEAEPQYVAARQALYAPESRAEASGPVQTATAVRPAPTSDLVKGYEYSKDHYVVVEPEEIRELTPQTSPDMEILEFVRLDEIDPLFFETSYYVVPEEAGAKAYALLFAAMRETTYTALAKVAMHRREHVMALRPSKTGLIAHTLFYTNEVRSQLEYKADTSDINPKELKLAKTLIETLAASFDPGKFQDQFRARLKELIDARVDHQKALAPPLPELPAPANVVNIMDALQKSLAQLRKPAAAAMEQSARASSHRSPKKRRSAS